MCGAGPTWARPRSTSARHLLDIWMWRTSSRVGDALLVGSFVLSLPPACISAGTDAMRSQPTIPIQPWRPIPAGPSFPVLESKLAPAPGRPGIVPRARPPGQAGGLGGHAGGGHLRARRVRQDRACRRVGEAGPAAVRVAVDRPAGQRPCGAVDLPRGWAGPGRSRSTPRCWAPWHPGAPRSPRRSFRCWGPPCPARRSRSWWSWTTCTCSMTRRAWTRWRCWSTICRQGSQLAVISQGEPPLPMARWRAEGRLAELGPDELAMDPAGGRVAACRAARVELADAEVAELTRRTEGWPVALYLAALSIKAQPGPRAGPGSAGGSGSWSTTCSRRCCRTCRRPRSGS